MVGTATRIVKVDNYPVNLYTSAFNYNIEATAISADGSVFVEVTSASTSKAYYSNGTQKGGNLTTLNSGSLRSCDISGDGNRIVIGEAQSRNVRIFDWNGSSWSTTDLGVPSAPAGLYASTLGAVTAISDDGNRVFVTDYDGSLNTSYDCGYIYVATYNGSSWSSVGNVWTGGSPYLYIGYAGDMSGDGNTFVFSNLGSSAFIETIRRTTGSYVSVNTAYTSFDIRNLSLSYDGNVMSAVIGTNVRIFEWNVGNWSQIGSDIPVNHIIDRAKLSGDGKRIVIGERYVNSQAGRTRLYEWNGTGWSLIDTTGGTTSTVYARYGEHVSINGNGDRIAASGDFELKVEQHKSRI